MDGASNAMGARPRIVVVTPEGIRVKHSFRLGFKASNNKAKYKALLVGLKAIFGLRATDLEVYSDS